MMGNDDFVRVPRAKLQYVRDLLTEKVYGSHARSPAHNARLEVDEMLSAAPPSPTPSGEVGEMVERLTKLLDWYGKHYFNTIPAARTLTYDRCMALSHMCTEAASLLQSLARERERLLYDLGSIANQCKVADDPEHMTLALVRKIAEHAIASSALPHQDKGGE